jgi:hypothetical protein
LLKLYNNIIQVSSFGFYLEIRILNDDDKYEIQQQQQQQQKEEEETF